MDTLSVLERVGQSVFFGRGVLGNRSFDTLCDIAGLDAASKDLDFKFCGWVSVRVEYEVMYRLRVMRTFQRPFHCYFLRSKSGTFTRFRKFLI
jgi:hypothetical protein